MLQKYVGDKAFYRRVMSIALPIMIQNAITTFVSLLDNLMVGQLGTFPMSGVSIVNQLLFVFNLIVFGITTGTGIFTAQFYGSQDHQGIRYTFRFKIIVGILLGSLCVAALIFWDDVLIRLFLQGDGSAEDAGQMLSFGQEYLKVMLWGLLPFALSGAYNSTLRECGQTRIPMIAGVTAVFTNLVLNYLLIFGHLGLPAMGVAGAALATVISRFVELAIVAGWTHLHSKEFPFIRGALTSLYIPLQLLRRLIIRVSPIVMNETMWSFAITFLNQCYTTCGLDVVNAINIVSTLDNLANVTAGALGNTIGILMGQMLGARIAAEQVRDENRKLMAFDFAAGVVICGLMMAVSGAFPLLYNTTDEIRSLASKLIFILAFTKPVRYFAMAVYYTIRSGGQTGLTFLYDCGFLWAVTVPVAFVLSRFTDMPILPLYFICQLPDILKALFGRYMVRKGGWIRNITL